MRLSYNLATIHPAFTPSWLQWYIFAWLSNAEIMEWHCPCARTATGILLAVRERVHVQMAISYNRCATPTENEPSQSIERQSQLTFLPLLKRTRSKQITVTKIIALVKQSLGSRSYFALSSLSRIIVPTQ